MEKISNVSFNASSEDALLDEAKNILDQEHKCSSGDGDLTFERDGNSSSSQPG